MLLLYMSLTWTKPSLNNDARDRAKRLATVRKRKQISIG